MPDPIPFDEWKPDLAERTNPTSEAKGVFSVSGHYAPFPDFQDYGPDPTLVEGAGIAVYLPFDGVDASTDIIDYAPGSTTTWTANANAEIDTAESEFGGASLLLDGASSVTAPDSAAFNLASSDFTIAGWFNCDATTGSAVAVIGHAETGFTAGWVFRRETSDFMAFYSKSSAAGSGALLTGTTAFNDALNVGFHHFAVTREGNDFRLFIDGALEDTATDAAAVDDPTAVLGVGAWGTTAITDFWIGWIDDVSIIIGEAIYTAAFTPPSAPQLHFGGGAEDVVIGADTFYDSTTAPQIFYGDVSRLYTLQSRTAVDVSKAGGYSAGADDTWQFAQFGDHVVAVTAAEDPQHYTMLVSTDFDDLAGSPPSGATSVARIGDFLMMGRDFGVHWCAFNDVTDWAPDPVTQAGNQELDQERGEVMCIVGLDYAAIFQERAIRRAIYVGPPVIFDFGQDYVEKARGAVSRNAAVAFGRVIFYAADDGFYAFDGQSSTPIGYGKVDSYYTRNLNYAFRHKISCGIDYQRKLVVWGIPTGSAQLITEFLIFALQDARWTHDVIDAEFVFDTPAEPFNVDNFATLYPEDDLDMVGILPDDIDSAAFDDRRVRVASFDLDHQMGLFVGQNRAATIDTREFEPAPGKRALLTEVWPLGDYDSASVSSSVRYRAALPGASLITTNATAMNRAGYCPQRVDARFMRIRQQITAGSVWRRAEAVHFTAKPTGGR